MTAIITAIKPVKMGTAIREDNNDIVGLHYSSEIVRVHEGHVTKLYVPSVTSSKFAKRILDYALGGSFDWKALKKQFNQ